MHFATGFAVPTGKATGAPGDSLGARYAWQVIALQLGLGAKVSEPLYIGGYLSIGAGAEGSDARVEDACDDKDQTLDNEISCSATSIQMGIEARYGFRPGEKTNPWLGYGIGLDSGIQSIHDRVQGRLERTTATGMEWARLSAGIDYRLGRVVGLGPALTVGIGQYTQTRTSINDQVSHDGDIEDRAFHAWVSLTFRLVLFP